MAGTETRRLTRTTTLRLSAEEVQGLREAAEAQGLGPSSLARTLVVAGIGLQPVPPRRRPSPEERALARLLGELGRMASSLNQVARAANARGALPRAADLPALRLALEALTREVLALRAEVSP